MSQRPDSGAPPTRIVVTGASGFVGRQAVEALSGAGEEIIALSRHSPEPLPPGVKFVACDLRNLAATSVTIRALRPSHLIHAAWSVPSGRFWHDPVNRDWITASLGLYHAFAAAGGRRALFVGSCAEYDWGDPGLKREDGPLAPATLYGSAKAQLHRMLAAAAAQQGISLAWARLFLLYGPYEAPGRLIPSVISGLLSGQAVATSAGSQQRDFMHVADAGAALAALLRSDVTGPVNIASGTTIAVRTVIERLGALLGSPELLDIGGRATPPGEPALLAAAIDRLRDEVGFTPRFDLDRGLADTIAWWRQQA